MALSHSLTACHPLPHILPHPHHMEHHWIRGLSVCPEQAVPQQGPGKCQMG